MSIQSLRYDGKRVLVVGGASGIGAAAARAAAELGAEVTVLTHVADPEFAGARTIRIDLRDRATVDGAATELGGPIHAVFSCAATYAGTGTTLVNFIAQRHLIEALRDRGTLVRGSAVVMTSSVAGAGWDRNLSVLLEFLGQSTWETATEWIEANEGTDSYLFSKQAINAYVAHEALALLGRGIRINAVVPGLTDTPMARVIAPGFSPGADYREKAGVEVLRPEEVASVMVFLGSHAASGITGETVVVDNGHASSVRTGSHDDPTVRTVLGV